MSSVIFINRYFYPDHSATSQLLSDLAFHLASLGFDVCVITSRHLYGDPMAHLKKEDRINGVRIKRVPTSRFGRQSLVGRAVDYLTFYLTSIWWLYREAAQPGSIIIAKTDPPLISIFSTLIVKLRNVLQINWIQDLFPEVAVALGVKKISPLVPLLRTLRNYSLRSASANVVLGDLPAQRLLSLGVEPDTIEVIPNWTDGSQIKPINKEINELRKVWGLCDKFVVGYSGNFGRAHEFGTILDAAELLVDRENIVFLFIGDGAQRDWIRRQSDERALKNVQFRPYQKRERLMESLGVADVHLISLLPGLEGYIVPSKFYGIAAAGRPTIYIGDPNGEIPKLLKVEGCGYTLSIGDSTRLAEHIDRLSKDQRKVLQMGTSARVLLETRYDKQKAMKTWESLIRRLQQDCSS